MLHHVVWYIQKDVSEGLTATNVSVTMEDVRLFETSISMHQVTQRSATSKMRATFHFYLLQSHVRNF